MAYFDSKEKRDLLKRFVDAYIIFEQATTGVDPRKTLDGTHMRENKSEGYKRELGDKYSNLLSTGGPYFDKVVESLGDKYSNLVDWRSADNFKKQNVSEKINTEQVLSILYGENKDEEVFELVREAAGGHYDLTGYLYFLKDPTKYLPIRSAMFDVRFKLLGIDSSLNGNCSWENYSDYIGTIREIQRYLTTGINSEISLLDAHSFVWMAGNISMYLDYLDNDGLVGKLARHEKHGQGTITACENDHGMYLATVQFKKQEVKFPYPEAFKDGSLTVIGVDKWVDPFEKNTVENPDVNNWLISANRNIYDFEAAFETLAYIYWRQNRNFQVDDVGYIYSTKPDQKIRYRFIVTEADIERDSISDIDKDNEFYVDKSEIPKSDSKCMKILITDSIDSDSVSLETLMEHGLNGRVQGGRSLTGELLDYVEECFRTEGRPFVRPEEDRQKLENEVSSLAIDLAEELLKLIKAGIRNITYGELSEMTDSKPNPHTQMKVPLIELSERCEALGLPHISAMVNTKATGSPGTGFKKLCVNSFGYDPEIPLEQMVEDELDMIQACEDWQQLADSLGLELDAEKIRETQKTTVEEEEIKFAKTLEQEELRQIAVSKSGKARKSTVKASPGSSLYVRDPYISEYAKRRANGTCQLCGKPAPFKNSKGEPYLESHHVVWLSEGGDDSVDNVVALCPNCHRKMHVLCDEADVEFLIKQL